MVNNGVVKILHLSSNAKIQANAFKQLTFLDAEYLKSLSPKMLNVAHKRLFTSLSIIKARCFFNVPIPEIVCPSPYKQDQNLWRLWSHKPRPVNEDHRC